MSKLKQPQNSFVNLTCVSKQASSKTPPIAVIRGVLVSRFETDLLDDDRA